MFLLTTSGTPVSHPSAHVLAESLLDRIVSLVLRQFKVISVACVKILRFLLVFHLVPLLGFVFYGDLMALDVVGDLLLGISSFFPSPAFYSYIRFRSVHKHLGNYAPLCL